jgi:hypothetical protein
VSTHLLGIRHHGPGSARALVAALERLEPSCVLIEGPPDADGVISLVGHAEMEPPIALMVYATEAPARAAFYPFAVYSPEWQAMRWAVARGVPVRFMDLPQAHQLDAASFARGDADLDAEHDPVADDPLGALARAAGYEDRELWWEQHVEQRRDPSGVFEAILEAMTALREGRPVRDRRERQREAYMRRTMRAAEREGHACLAVVCGAWHAPALNAKVSQKDDDAALRGLPKTKVTATWVPWSRGRLASKNGYGAGVRSPGWYEHLWRSPSHVAERWLTEVARLLRGEGLAAAPGSVIEAVRLAEALAALRDRAMPGLEELHEATRAVLTHGSDAQLALIRERLEIGRGLGRVPPDAPMVPLAQDVAAQQKTLRLKVSAEAKVLDLDLRNDTDRARSRLLHRLRLLDVEWGSTEEVQSAGTFKERWTLQWDPELALALVEASVHGNTVEVAAGARGAELARRTDDLAELTALLHRVVLAELADAVDAALARVSAVSAQAGDARALMKALPPLARAARWGTVRGTAPERLLPVLDVLFARVVVGLPGACTSLDHDAAHAVRTQLDAVTGALRLLDRAEPLLEWHTLLLEMLGQDVVHALVRGACARLLLEAGHLETAELARHAQLALSPAVEPARAAAWAEGVLGQSATLPLAHEGLWRALDRWLLGLDETVFLELLPLVRRAFAGVDAPARRVLGERVRALGDTDGPRVPIARRVVLDESRVELLGPLLRQVVGLDGPAEERAS